ncbi:MAG: hypothetical protein ABL959_21900, partial [Pyrinomonadaceae bacterium]
MTRCSECRRDHCGMLFGGLVFLGALSVLIFITTISGAAQQAAQNPSPMTDTTRPHPRIEKVEVLGRRTELAALKGSILFAGP